MGDEATVALWDRLVRPMDPAGAVEALTGMAPHRARSVVGVALAVSAEAEDLLDRLPEIVRSLSIATISRPIRTTGDVRGTILWAETIAARAASPGAHNALVCASPVKAYDTAENQVLAHALKRLRDAARDGDPGPGVGEGDSPADEKVRHMRRAGALAGRYLEHRTLLSVSRDRPTGRDLRKARTGTKSRSYAEAVAVLERAAEPVSGAAVAGLCDDHTRRLHGLVIYLLDGLARAGVRTVCRVERGTVSAAPVRFLSRHRAGPDGLYGVLVGDVLVDVAVAGSDPGVTQAALSARAHGHPTVVVRNAGDITRAIELADVA